MEDAYGIGITNRYDFLLDTDSIDPQAILKQKAKKAKKAAKKLAGKENSENDGKVEANPSKLNDDKKVKFVVPGKGGKQLQPQQEPPQKSRSMKDTQNIQGNENVENGTGFRETRNNFDRDRNHGNNRNYENRDQRFNRRNKEGANESNDAGNRTSQENGSGQPNRGNRSNYGNRNNENRNNENRNENRNYENRNNENRNNENRNNENRNFENRNVENKNFENSNNGQELELNQQSNNQRDRDDDRSARRQGNERNFGNRRNYDGQRRNNDGRGGKREFDRQSGSDRTGVKAVEKREGGGAHNWGTHKQDIDDLNKNASDPDLKDEGNSDEHARSEENLAPPEIQLTLDEYKKQIGERAKPVYNTRKAGEGEDKKKWKNLVPLQKKNEDAKSEDEYEFDPAQYPQRKRGIRYIVDIKVRFNEGKRPGFVTNNSRRRRQTDGPRNDDGNGNLRQNAPQVDDRNFPSLG